jgi:uncharacterized surface protein with fasciclin (FAS1) repeats
MKTRLGMLVLATVVATGCTQADSPVGLTIEEQAQLSRGAVTPAQPARGNTIVQTALAVNAETGEFSTLIAAVLAADVAGALSASGQRTVFAPTDSAFALLGLNADNIGDLSKEALTEILLYHVAPGRRTAAQVVGSSQIRMANGGFTVISVNEEGAFIDAAKIIATDIDAGNGLIHVIDAVLLP